MQKKKKNILHIQRLHDFRYTNYRCAVWEAVSKQIKLSYFKDVIRNVIKLTVI